MSEFNLNDGQDMLDDLSTQQPRPKAPVAFALSRRAYDSLRAEFDAWPQELKHRSDSQHVEINGILAEVEAGQEVPCWAFYDLQFFRAYMDPRVPPASFETLQRLRKYESI